MNRSSLTESLTKQLDQAATAAKVSFKATRKSPPCRRRDRNGHRITDMELGQAFTANLITGMMVFGASKIGVPVSTTHVSCGSIFGIGAVTGKAKWETIKKILLA